MSSAAKVGVFMLIVLAILGYFILKIEDVQIGHGTGARKITAVFDSVAGLHNKTPLRGGGGPPGEGGENQTRPGGKNHGGAGNRSPRVLPTRRESDHAAPRV